MAKLILFLLHSAALLWVKYDSKKNESLLLLQEQA